MGREHRLPRDARLRQEGDRRDARVPLALCHTTRRLELDAATAVAGIDVGEDFLDLALLPSRARTLRAARVDLRGIAGEADNSGAIAEMARRLAQAAPELAGGAIVLVDSPRWPCDLDWSAEGVAQRRGHAGGRTIDASLRLMMRELHEGRARPGLSALSMFPTPRLDYFRARIAAANCKPHLRALGRELFGSAGTADSPAPFGGSFTRFMISGFAAYRALAMMGIESYEAYPDLQFRLWASSERLPSKKNRRLALRARQRIVARLAQRLGVEAGATAATLDQADAAILALSAAAAAQAGAIVIIEQPAEGRFLVAIDQADAQRLG